MKSAWIFDAGTGLMIGAISIVASVSLAAMVFSGALAEHLVYGVHIALITAVITGAVLALSSSCEIAIAIPQDRTAPILAFMAAGIASTAPTGMPMEELFLTVVAAIVTTSLITGAFLLGLGLARAGGLMRFIPYSVLGGFFAGTGWLLIVGGLQAMTGIAFDSPQAFMRLGEDAMLPRWLPGLALALSILLATRYLTSGLAVTSMLAIAALLFFGVMHLGGQTLESLGQSGWLLGPLQDTVWQSWELGLPRLLGDGNWAVVLAQWPNIGTVVAISSVSIMLTVSALEMLSGKDIDINHELRITGVANIAAGVSGGMVGFHSLSISNLSLKMGAASRLTGIVAALTAAAALLFGTTLLGYLPRIVVGGLLLFIGLSFIVTWLFGSWRRLPHGEYLVIPLILVTIAFAGFIEGLFVGLLAALAHFVLKYSRTAVIRYAMSGADARSTVDRGIEDERYLAEHGERLLVLKLRGYLFFGTTTQVSGRIRERLEDAAREALRYVLLDFQAVNGIDSSAAYEFHRLKLLAEQNGFALLLTGMADELQKPLRAAHILDGAEQLRLFDSLDLGLEWCETRLLTERASEQARPPQTALEILAARLPGDVDGGQILAYLSEQHFAPGSQIIGQGDRADDLYFLEDGDVSVFIHQAGGERTRLRRTGPGTVIGEIGFYLGSARSASVVADNAVRVYRLSTEALRRMERESPELAAAFHRFMADLLAERLLRTTHALEGATA